MDSSCISYTRAPKASALFLDYLYHFDRVRSFYGGSPSDIASYQSVARESGQLYLYRDELADILLRQNQTFGCGEASLANIQRLREPGTFAVVTGQQAGLFSGPAFTLYKALTALRLAADLNEQGLPCVPVFWLATEDHDLAEVSKAVVLNEAGDLVPLTASGDGVEGCSVGWMKFSGQVVEALAELERALPPGEARDRLLSDLRACYVPGTGWGEALARFLARLFSHFGVILLDPLNEAVHRLARPVYARALQDAPRWRRRLEERAKALTESGYHAQVHVGEDSTLLFAVSNGRREAIRERDGRFRVGGAAPASLEALQSWMDARPLDFTPSALLRPVVQDSILPTVAYVAGPAELAYLGQSQVIYSEVGRPVPVLYARAGFTLADRHQQRIMEKYHLGLDDIWQGEDHLRRKIAAAGSRENSSEDWAGQMDRGQDAVRRVFEDLRQDVERIDPTLVDAMRNTQEKINYQLDRLRGKISRAALERSEVLQRHEEELLRFLMPAGNLQEREVGGVHFLARAGYELLDRLLEQTQSRCQDHQFVVY